MSPMRGLLLLLLAFGWGATPAIEGARSVAQLHHTAWYAKDGAPTDAWAIAQTRDGWLWFGTPSGLYRFDGVAFERVATDARDPDRSRAVSTFLALDSGGLLIGYVHGGASLWQNGAFTHYPTESGFAAGAVYSFDRDSDGNVWAATRGGLMVLEGGRWRRIDHDSDFPDGRATDVAVDAGGTVWAASQAGVFRLARGSRRFERVSSTDLSPFVHSHDGRIWYLDGAAARNLSMAVDARLREPSVSARASNVWLFATEGSIWSVWDGGVAYGGEQVRSTLDRLQMPAPDTSAVGKAMLAEGAKTVMEDREGNVWISTVAGIHRFHRANVVQMQAEGIGDILAAGLMGDGDAGIWMTVRVGTQGAVPGDGLWQVGVGSTRVQPKEIPWATAIHRARDGHVWVAGDALWRHDGRHFVKALALPPAAEGQFVQCLTEDAGGDVWVSIPGTGLFRHHGDAWQRNGGLASLPPEAPLTQARDPAGRIWLGYADSRVIAIEGDRITSFAAGDGIGVGAVTAISAGRHTLVAGDAGLALLRDGTFRMLTTSDALAFQGARGLVEAGNGDVWLNGLRGVVRIPGSALQQASSGGNGPIAVEVFDHSEGYPGSGAGATMVAQPRIAIGTDGRIWVSGGGGIAWIDPENIRRNTVPPSVLTRSLTSNGRRHDATNPVLLSPGTRNVQVDYTALSYAHPERVRFRYRLEGFEDSWTEAGTRRQAFYTNLGPGAYRFAVMASNENGLWSVSPATLEFTVPPTFVQTKGFLALCAAAAIMLLALAYRWRVRHIMARQRSRMEERLAERERIARELHDTLLQSTQGLVLRFQAAANRIDASDPVRRMLAETLQRADAVMVEGRDRVLDLRVPVDTVLDLPQALAAAGDELARGREAPFTATVEGNVRKLVPQARDEAYRIGREALLNAFTHGEARSVEVQLLYERDALRLRVRDDGRGIDIATLGNGARPGHWGLVGMRERAHHIGAELDIWSRPGAGTEIELRIPASVAYADHRKGQFWSRLRNPPGDTP